jgi:hypothetical protein
MTLDSSQNVAFLSISPITYLLPVPKGRPDGASVVTDGWRRPENALRVPLLENEFRVVAKQPQLPITSAKPDLNEAAAAADAFACG